MTQESGLPLRDNQEQPARLDAPSRPAGGLQRFRRIFPQNKLAGAASIILFLILTTAIFAPGLAFEDPTRIDLSLRVHKLPPSPAHPLGTDDLGRDVWSRMVYGARVSLIVAFLTTVFSVTFGSIYGALSGFYGGRIDMAMMRFVDIMLSLPTMFLLIIFAAFIRPNAAGIALIISLTSWMGIARIVRGEFLRFKELEFVDAARAMGFSNSRIIFRHILPNVTAPIIVNATLMVAYAILTESTLSFLGLGVQPPQFSWGSMLTSAQDLVLLKEAPWMAIFPGLAIFTTVLCINFCGDGLRDELDPKLKNTHRQT
jgi:peptide/nickel transport system permease protein